jgi:fructose-1-phosphate kinase PfkB-like protein
MSLAAVSLPVPAASDSAAVISDKCRTPPHAHVLPTLGARLQICAEMLQLKPTVVRGNASEIMALAGAAGATTRGVDSTAAATGAFKAQPLAAAEVVGQRSIQAGSWKPQCTRDCVL